MESEHRLVVMIACLATVVLFGFIGCTAKYNEGVKNLQIACFAANHSALECKEVAR